MGLLVGKDSTLFRNYFDEMSKLIGIQVKYMYPIDMNFSMYGDENPLGFSEPEWISIIFDENPSIRTLKKYGWVTEGEERQPYMAQFSYNTENLAKGCRIEIPSNLPDKGRLFVVTDMTTNLEFPESYMCKLAPVFHTKNTEEKINNSVTKSTNTFINIDA